MLPVNYFWFFGNCVVRSILGVNPRRYDNSLPAIMRDHMNARRITFCHVLFCSTVLPSFDITWP